MEDAAEHVKFWLVASESKAGKWRLADDQLFWRQDLALKRAAELSHATHREYYVMVVDHPMDLYIAQGIHSENLDIYGGQPMPV